MSSVPSSPVFSAFRILNRVGVRQAYGFVVSLVIGLLGFGLYLQHVVGLEPCPMCIVQRYLLVAAGIAALVGLASGHGWQERKIRRLAVPSFMGIFSLLGAWVAARQSLLQYEAHNNPFAECGPGIEYLIEMHGFSDAMPFIFKGSGDCAAVDWTFLGLSIANWSLLNFVFLFLIAIAIGWKSRKA